MSASQVPEELLQRIRREHRFLLTAHANPDGDAVGSELGLARVLRRLGKGSAIWNRDETPSLYRHLPGADRIHVGEPPPKGFPDSFDSVIVLECPSLDRTGLAEALRGLPLLNIDHHLGNEHYGSVNWVDTASPAVGEMVYRLALALKVDLDPDTANALFLTLVTDTGGFRFSNSTAAAFEAAAALVREGARPELVSKWLFESRPEPAVRLLGEMLETLELHDDGRVASVYLTREMYGRTGASESDAEGLIDVPRSIAGVEAVTLLKELDNNRHKISLRSRGEVDIEKIARRKGGGGHKNAAGFTAEGPRDQVQSEIVQALREALR